VKACPASGLPSDLFSPFYAEQPSPYLAFLAFKHHTSPSKHHSARAFLPKYLRSATSRLRPGPPCCARRFQQTSYLWRTQLCMACTGEATCSTSLRWVHYCPGHSAGS